MRTVKSPLPVAYRLRLALLALKRGLILPWLALLFAGLSACATPHRLSPETAPQIQLTETLRSSPCLRGRLPDPDWLDVGGALTLWLDAEGRAECEAARAAGVVAVIDRFNAEMRDWLRGR
jgi:hypothetical protein